MKLRVVLSLVLLSGLASLAGSAHARPAAQPLTKVRISEIRSINYLATYVADAQGFFKKQGIQAEFLTVTSPSTALIAGDADLAHDTVDGAIHNASIGHPTPVLAVDQ